MSIGKQYNMKKYQKIYEEYNIDLEIDQNSQLYKSWNEKWIEYLKNLNGLYENKALKNIKFNIVEHYTEDGLEKGDFDTTNKKIIESGLNYNSINLFDKKNKHIFLEFINLKLDINSIQKFINKYGLLGSPVVQKKYLEQGENEYKEGSVIQSELIQCWFVEIKNLQSLVKNYQYFSDKNYEKLNEKFKIFKKENKFIWEFNETEFKEASFPLSIRFSKNDQYQISIDETDIKINKDNIDNIFTDYLVEIVKTFYSGRIRAHIDSNNNWFSTNFAPKGLIGVIWHQVIKLIEEKNQIKNCSYCKKEFVIGQGEARKNKEFCTRSHAVLSKREDNISKNISKIFTKKGYEVKFQEINSRFDFIILKNKKKVSGVNISFSESLDSNSKKWNFLIKKKIVEPMVSENLNSAYLINKNFDCFLFNKENTKFKKLKSPLDYKSLTNFIKNNEKKT